MSWVLLSKYPEPISPTIKVLVMGSRNPNVGALLTWYGCEGTISDCNFINNTADNGAAYRLGDDNKGVSSASVDSCTFINNTASNQGGAVYEGEKQVKLL